MRAIPKPLVLEFLRHFGCTRIAEDKGYELYSNDGGLSIVEIQPKMKVDLVLLSRFADDLSVHPHDFDQWLGDNNIPIG